MMTKEVDITKWAKAIEALEGICAHIQSRSVSRSDRLYYELYTKYFQKLKRAMEEGADIAAHSTFTPPELFYAMDMIPVLLVSSSGAMTVCAKNYKEALDSSKEYGISVETCSGHRIQMAHFIEGWFPRPKVVVDIGTGCDAFSNSGCISAELYGCPDFYIDAPYHYTERGVQYFAQELEELVQFLEEITQRKMDWERLKEMVRISAEMADRYREIAHLRKAVPSPMESRRAWQAYWIYWIYAGALEGLTWFRTLRDELKEKVEQKRGAVSQERFRLLDLFMHPQYTFKLLDWMGEKYGAVIVNEVIVFYWREGEMDPSKPLEALARRFYYAPVVRCALGSGKESLETAVKQAKEYKVDGALFWAQNNCRQAGIIGSLKDILAEEVGIPTLVIDCDIMDPTFVTVEEMRKKLEEFFEILEDRRLRRIQ